MVQAAWKAGANKCLIKSTCGPILLVEEVRELLTPTSAAPPAPMTNPGASVSLRPDCYASTGSQSAEKGGDRPASDLRRDLLGKPVLLIELAVKALTLLLRARVNSRREARAGEATAS